MSVKPVEKTPTLKVEPFGNYYLLERIAVGGMAEIFKAKQVGVRGFEKIVVIKKILQHLGEDPEFVEMFEDEAKIAAQLTHANIVQIYELGEVDGNPYITMEFVDGKNLRDITRAIQGKGIHLGIDQCVMLMIEILKGIDYAHRKIDSQGSPLHIIHRDMSPQNVIISYEGEVKILDFGIAKAASKASKTEAGVLKGKFSYMSPEQASGKIVTQGSDIYACGVMLHELLTSERLFRAKTDVETLERVKEGTVTAPSEKNPLIPDELDRIVLRSLAKDQGERYASASEMLTDLTRLSFEQKYTYSSQELSAFMKTLFSESIAEEKSRLVRALQLVPQSPDQAMRNARTHIAFKRPTESSESNKAQASPDLTVTVSRQMLPKHRRTFIFATVLLGAVLIYLISLLFRSTIPPETSTSTPSTKESLTSQNQIDFPEIDVIPTPSQVQDVLVIEKPIEKPEVVPPKPEPEDPKPQKPATQKPKPVRFGYLSVVAPTEGYASLYINNKPHGSVPGPKARNIKLEEGKHVIRCETTQNVYTGRIQIKADERLTVNCQNLK